MRSRMHEPEHELEDDTRHYGLGRRDLGINIRQFANHFLSFHKVQYLC